MQSKKLKIALIGYGKMGKTIENLALKKSYEIALRTNRQNPLSNQLSALEGIDVAIEFTNPEIAPENLEFLAKNKIPTICGSTAWLDKFDYITELYKSNQTPFLYASNFSIGVNVFFALNKNLAKIMNSLGDYDIKIIESHHIGKKDAPSGTAISIAEQVISSIDRKSSWTKADTLSEDYIHIESIREADVKGMHEVIYNSSIDQISIKHEAFSREGFASGALTAAEWIIDKNGIFGMNDVFNFEQ